MATVRPSFRVTLSIHEINSHQLSVSIGNTVKYLQYVDTKPWLKILDFILTG
jgi:hypothetical protein